MKIRNKYKNSIHEIIEENDDIENLTEGEKFYRVWKDGEFQLYEVPIVQKDGSIILPKDTLFNVSEEVESNIDIKSTDYKKWDKFWNNHSVTQYIIKGGFEIIDEKNNKKFDYINFYISEFFKYIDILIVSIIKLIRFLFYGLFH